MPHNASQPIPPSREELVPVEPSPATSISRVPVPPLRVVEATLLGLFGLLASVPPVLPAPVYPLGPVILLPSTLPASGLAVDVLVPVSSPVPARLHLGAVESVKDVGIYGVRADAIEADSALHEVIDVGGRGRVGLLLTDLGGDGGLEAAARPHVNERSEEERKI